MWCKQVSGVDEMFMLDPKKNPLYKSHTVPSGIIIIITR